MLACKVTTKLLGASILCQANRLVKISGGETYTADLILCFFV